MHMLDLRRRDTHPRRGFAFLVRPRRVEGGGCLPTEKGIQIAIVPWILLTRVQSRTSLSKPLAINTVYRSPPRHLGWFVPTHAALRCQGSLALFVGDRDEWPARRMLSMHHPFQRSMMHGKICASERAFDKLPLCMAKDESSPSSPSRLSRLDGEFDCIFG